MRLIIRESLVQAQVGPLLKSQALTFSCRCFSFCSTELNIIEMIIILSYKYRINLMHKNEPSPLLATAHLHKGCGEWRILFVYWRCESEKLFISFFPPSFNACPSQQIAHINASIHIALFYFRTFSIDSNAFEKSTASALLDFELSTPVYATRIPPIDELYCIATP